MEIFKSGYIGYKYDTITQLPQRWPGLKIYQKMIYDAIVRILGHLSQLDSVGISNEEWGILTITWLCHLQLLNTDKNEQAWKAGKLTLWGFERRIMGVRMCKEAG